ncbi:HD domain-containing protein [Paenibacillus sp. CAA11]|uniref:HD domain-containing protein n=1 Tax=Paenibacillus sp. CAA11 TaxID=1532905 RepID=UPI001902A8DF|nr:HD domain-containing protein [Paenibacillus sp. CAA11]
MRRRLEQQLNFIREIDRLKGILRQTILMDKSRRENDAEHSWHIAMMAVLLNEYAEVRSLDLLKVLRMLLIHDIVEIDAGDTFAYDAAGHLDKFEREERAAKRIFGLLPKDQADELLSLWMEFEGGDTAEAGYARAMDRIQPLLHNYYTEGEAWRKHGVARNQVLARVAELQYTVPPLYSFVTELIDDAVVKGYLRG